MIKSKFVSLALVLAIFGVCPAHGDGDLQAPPGVVVPDDGEGPAGVVESYTPPQAQQYGNSQPSQQQTTLPATNSGIYVDSASGERMMEQCHVLDNDGNGLIKAYMADSGPNLEGDASAWIWVPRGECARLNAGQYSGISPEILNKINPSDVTQAQTIE